MTVAPLSVLSLRQPWAGLVRTKKKWIETRGWRARRPVPFRLGIASSAKPHRGAWNGPLMAATSEMLGGRTGSYDAIDRYPEGLSLGELEATCEVIAFAPIGGPYSFRTGTVQGDEGDRPGQPVVVLQPALSPDEEPYLCIDWPGAKKAFGWGLGHDNITDQLPLGDYTAGRVAWILADIQPLAKRCPACWGSGTQADGWRSSYSGHGIEPLGGERQRLLLPCWVCQTTGRRRDPIPVKGARGLWTWTPPVGLQHPDSKEYPWLTPTPT